MFKVFISAGVALTCLLGLALLADAAPTGPLAQVIEGAKKEGTVSVKLVPPLADNSMSRLEKEIKDKYGVSLKIKFTGTMNMPNDVSEAIMEDKAGAVPSYDLLSLANHVATANPAGVLERVDWKPLISEGTNPIVIHDNPLMRGSIVYHTAHYGLMYNPEKVKPNEVPKTLADLANPKWKGRGGISFYPNSWIRWCFILGKEKVLSSLRAIMKNGAIQGAYADLLNRYVLGEIWFCTTSSEYLGIAREKGVPTSWQCLDFADVVEFDVVVRKGASHANAAKLLSVYLASPEGAKFQYEEGKLGNLYYPGNEEHEIRLQNQKQGIPEVFGDRRMELLEFYTSKDGAQLGKEIQMVLQSGGR